MREFIRDTWEAEAGSVVVWSIVAGLIVISLVAIIFLTWGLDFADRAEVITVPAGLASVLLAHMIYMFLRWRRCWPQQEVVRCWPERLSDDDAPEEMFMLRDGTSHRRADFRAEKFHVGDYVAKDAHTYTLRVVRGPRSKAVRS